MIKYSVIIPIYNAEKTVRRCVDSLLSGCPENAEIILVNDGSTDGSGEICRRYAREHPAVRLIEQENGGVSTARNAGMDAVRGSYICFVDSDDYVSPDYFPQIERALEKEAWDLIRFSWFQDDGETMRRRHAAPLNAATRDEALPRIIDDICSKALNSTRAKVYRKELIDRHSLRFPVGASLAEDRAFNIRYSMYIQKYCVDDSPIYNVNTENQESLSRKRRNDHEQQFQVADHYVEDAIRASSLPAQETEQYCRAINFGECRSIYREAKELIRDQVGWLGRQKYLMRCCGRINRQHMRYPKTKYCRLITLPVRLRLTPVIDLVAWKLTRS